MEKDADVTVYFLPTRIQKRRLEILKKCAKQKKIKVSEQFTPNVTHVITECENRDQVVQLLNADILTESSVPTIVTSSWFTDSVDAGKLLDCAKYTLRPTSIEKNQTTNVLARTECGNSSKHYICQRPTKLCHKNHKLTDALEVMAEEAELSDDAVDYGRALAFRRAAAVLKQLTNEVTSVDEISNLPDIGSHSRKIIQEILEDGVSTEVQVLQESEKFKTLKLFCKVYGIGSSTASKWFNKGLRTIEQVKEMPDVKSRKDSRVAYGLAFFNDLTSAVTRKEADKVFNIIRKHLPQDVIIHLVGGFRRGKQSGHDIDFIVSHPIEGQEAGLLRTFYAKLQTEGYILHGAMEKGTFEKHLLTKESKSSHRSTLDHFEKAFLIFKLPVGDSADMQRSPSKLDGDVPIEEVARQPRNFVARRVDVVIAPRSQLAYALVGWTGNKQFNRSLREYTKKELGFQLTSHGLFDTRKRVSLPAESEEDVFAHLKLSYLTPEDRNP